MIPGQFLSGTSRFEPLPMMNHKAKGKKSTTISFISTMEYGDSVLFKTRKRANYFAVQVRYYLKTRNKSGRACVRTVENGFRVWLLNKNKEEEKKGEGSQDRGSG